MFKTQDNTNIASVISKKCQTTMYVVLVKLASTLYNIPIMYEKLWKPHVWLKFFEEENVSATVVYNEINK